MLNNAVLVYCSFDYYKRQLAVCDLNGFVQIWVRNKQGSWISDTKWKCSSSNASGGQVKKILWALPEHGDFLAASFTDNTITIWHRNDNNEWITQSILDEAKSAVYDFVFAPRPLSLALASVTSNGVLRIYGQAQHSRLCDWQLMDEVLENSPIASISWTSSIADTASASAHKSNQSMIALGTGCVSREQTNKVLLTRPSERTHRWTRSPNEIDFDRAVTDLRFSDASCALGSHLLAVISQDIYVFKLTPVSEESTSDIVNIEWNLTCTKLLANTAQNETLSFQLNHDDSWSHVQTTRNQTAVEAGLPQAVDDCLKQVVPTPTRKSAFPAIATVPAATVSVRLVPSFG